MPTRSDVRRTRSRCWSRRELCKDSALRPFTRCRSRSSATPFAPEERDRALAIWTAVAALGLAAGPLVGGAVVESASWRWIFVLLVPFALGSFAIASVAVRESRDEAAPRSIDIGGAVVSAVALVAFVSLLIQGESWGVAAPTSAIVAGIVLIAMPAFVAIERRASVPLLELALFANRRFLGAVVTSFVLAFVAWAALFFLPLDFQHVRDHSTLVSGVLLLPCTAPWALTSLATARIVQRVGTRVPMAGGLALAAAGLAVLALPDPALAIVLAALAVVGAGIGVALAPMTAAALNAVPAAKAGMAAGALLMARMVGATVGVATSGAVFTALENRKLDALEQPLSRPEITDVTSLLSGSASAADTLSRLPPASARVLVADAAEAFSHGLTGAMALTASVAAIGAASRLRARPTRRALAHTLLSATCHTGAEAASVLLRAHHPSVFFLSGPVTGGVAALEAELVQLSVHGRGRSEAQADRNAQSEAAPAAGVTNG